MARTKPTIIELDMGELEQLLQRIDAQELRAEDSATLKALAQSYVHLTELLQDKNTTLARLRKLLFGATTEKTAAVTGHSPGEGGQDTEAAADTSLPIPPGGDAPAAPESEGNEAQGESPASGPAAGHGRNGADAYTGAQTIQVLHPSLQPGDPCPDCEKGTVYETHRPGVLVRLVGQTPVGAKVYYLQKLRCNLCGKVFTAEAPEAAGEEKYDPTVGGMIALLKYGSGMPFNRLARLQGTVGIPLPASTQWDLVHELAEQAEPALEELIRQAAQGDVVYNDDTTAKILEWMGKRAKEIPKAENAKKGGKRMAAERKGIFTSGIVSTREGRRIALFFSGHQHAGENLKDVLSRRAAELAAPIQMCDALSRNVPAELQTILAHCLAHGRRQFVDVAERFPQECRHVLEAIAVIYKNDALARERNLSPEARLEFHQAESGPTMTELKAWLARQFEDRLVEPNSALGEAISYLLKHWEKLTLFLKVPGAPLDNNLCERVLKKAILHRKNALFYKTPRGAHVGDLFMSLIHTAELCGADAFEYLTELARHAKDVAAQPQGWMPWNYRQTLATTPSPAAL
jgi:transposase